MCYKATIKQFCTFTTFSTDQTVKYLLPNNWEPLQRSAACLYLHDPVPPQNLFGMFIPTLFHRDDTSAF